MKLEICYILRVYFALYLEDYLNDFPHEKDEEEILKNLIERMYSEPKQIMIFNQAEVGLLCDSIEYACEIREFVPAFDIEHYD